MNIDQLNSRFGAPGRIVFRIGHCGYPEAVLASRFGVAEVALLGGNVLSYRPTGHSETIFRPSKRDYNRGDAFHGGIPVCWPQFGRRFSQELPQHGFARKMPFTVRGSVYSDEMTELTLGLKSDEATKSLWPHDFDLELKITVSMKLNLKLTTVNTGKEDFQFSCGFHPYLLTGDSTTATVRGVDGFEFLNADDGTGGRQSGDFTLNRPVDHVFTLPAAPKNEFAVMDPRLKRAIAVVSSGNERLVIWNPGEKASIADFDADSWRRFVCVEPVSDWPLARTLAPGEKHELCTAIQSAIDL